ncbi:MAG: phage virion morphogenesis protein [Thiotrichaceae bacterium]|nr:phage virion morphogenesis protein [Thiotrichaceae bacterium]
MSEITIKVSIPELDAWVNKLHDFPRRELMQTIASKSEEQVKTRINEEKMSPVGAPWAAWSDNYAKRRPSGTGLLVNTGDLLQSITGQVTGDNEIIVSTSVPYAPRQNFGGGGIPAREFMGLSQENIEEIKDLVLVWFESYLGE